MFVDVTGFTAASHALDSEEVFVWMDEMMRILAATIARYDGTIDKYTGDGLMALFGAPHAHENDPERAVRAGMEILESIAPVRERTRRAHGFDFLVRIGINTGAVVAGTVGGDVHAEYTVLGDTVNLAARLEKAAAPGTILVSATAYARTAPIFRFDALPPLHVKGVDEPLQTYRPLGLAAVPGSLRGLDGLSSPLVGREDDLARLLAMLAFVQHTCQPGTALLLGEAGMGKSRLVRELERAASQTGVRFFRGASYAHTQSHPLWLIADLLRGVLQLPVGLSPAELHRRLPAALTGCGVVDDDVQLYIAHTLGAIEVGSPAAERLRALDPAILRTQTHAAVRQLFLALANRAPTVLILDDLHWIDPASRDVVEHLLRTAVSVPLAFVLVARPEAQPTIRPLVEAAGHTMQVSVSVEGLAGDAGCRLVNQLLSPPAEDVRALAPRIVQRAGGNPFYIEEIIRVLLDRGALRREEGVWITAPWTEAVLAEVPGNLKALILARFDNLSADLRSLLKYVAVLGRSITARLLQQLSPGTPEGLEYQLAELVARHFLSTDAKHARDGSARYTFQHVLVRDAIYETILRRDRQVLHRRVAEAVSSIDDWLADERTEILAYQYGESDEPARAIPLLVDAGDHAARRSASETAVAHYRRALALMAEYPASYGDLVFRARLGLGRALKFAGQFAAAAEVLQEALERLQVAILSRDTWLGATVEVLGELADVRFREGAYDQAVAQLETGLTTLGADGSRTHTRLWRGLLNRLAYVRFRQGALEQASSLARLAVSDADGDAGDPVTLANLYSTLGGVLASQGNLSEAIGYVERSIKLYQSLNYTWGLANAYTNLGNLHYAQGDWPQALASFERSLALRQEAGSHVEQALTLTNLAMLRMVLGDHEQARVEFETSLQIGRRLGDEYGMVRAYLGLIHLAVIQGRYLDAAEQIEAAQACVVAAGEDEIIQLLWLRALTSAATGDLGLGLSLVEEALTAARGSGLAEQEAECLRVYAQLCLARGALTDAEALLETSLALCRERADPYQEALALTVLGELHVHADRAGAQLSTRGSGAEALVKAAAIFEQLGARYDAHRARRLLTMLTTDPEGHRSSEIVLDLSPSVL
jgi:adenylate cyclase